MNNFLDHFTGEKYDKLLDEQEENAEEPQAKEDEEKTEENIKTKTDEAKKQTSKSTRRRNDSIEIINKDPNYQKKKIVQHGLLVAAILIVMVGGFLIYRTVNERTLPDFVDHPIAELKEWSTKNRIELEISTEYSMKYDKDHVISIDKKNGSKLQTGDLLKVKVSDGANPEETLKLPDFSTYDETKINTWIKENRATNLKVAKEYNDKVDKGKFIKLEFADQSVTSDTYKRKDYATIFVSKGKESFEKNIEVPQFVNEDVSKVTDWTSKNELKLKQTEEYSNTVDAGKVISQSVPAKDKVAKKDEFTIVVSKGKAMIVPDFSTYNLQTINETGASESVPYIVVERYNATVPYGQLIAQDIAPGTIIEDGNVKNVILTYSIGLPYINRDDIINRNEKDLRDYFFRENEKGANLDYTIQYVSPGTCGFKPAIKGISCGANYDNQFVQIGSHIIIKLANADSPNE